MKKFTIEYHTSTQRADKFVKKVLAKAPLSFIYKLFRKKDVKINGKPIEASYRLEVGDTLEIYVTDQQWNDFHLVEEITPAPFPYPIIYEDQHVLIVNKPSGVLVHQGNDPDEITLEQSVLSYLKLNDEWQEGQGFTPAPAHRLDRNTSGIVVIGKSVPALQALSNVFLKDQAIKTYLALVVGTPPKSGKINASLLKNARTGNMEIKEEGQSALTTYETLEYYTDTALVEIKIQTGRNHQIRAHLAYINHPVVGDHRYGDPAINNQFQARYNVKNQLLCAKKLTLINVDEPLTYLEKQSFEAELEKQFKDIVVSLKKEAS